MNERRQRYAVLPLSGALLDETVMRWWMGEWDRRAPRTPNVERLSKSEPDIVAFEATARGNRAR